MNVTVSVGSIETKQAIDDVLLAVMRHLKQLMQDERDNGVNTKTLKKTHYFAGREAGLHVACSFIQSIKIETVSAMR